MSKYNQLQLDKSKIKLAAATSKPDSPKYGDQATLLKGLTDIDERFDSQIREEGKLAQENQAQRWSKNGGGSLGDDLIAGVRSGMREGSILDDKERMAKYKTGIEKIYKMVESQNEELAKQERLYSARQAILPNWTAYSKRFSVMSPAEREQAIDSMIQKYNEVAGTNYRRGSVDGKEPWKVTVIDGDEAQVIDLMDLMKTPEAIQVEMMMQSPEYRQMESGLQAEQAMDDKLKQATLNQRQAKANEIQQGINTEQNYKEIENRIKQETGDSVVVLDSLRDKPSQWNHAIKGIEDRIKAGNAAAQTMQVLDRLDEIVNKNPRIFSSLGAVLTNAHKKEPTALSTLASNLGISSKDRADFEEAGKLIQHMYTTGLHSLPKGSRLNMYLEQEFRKGVPDLSMVPEAFKRITNYARKEAYEIYEDGEKTSDYYQQGLEYKPKIKPIDGGKLTPEFINELREKHPELKDVSDKDIEKAYRDSKKGAVN